NSSVVIRPASTHDDDYRHGADRHGLGTEPCRRLYRTITLSLLKVAEGRRFITTGAGLELRRVAINSLEKSGTSIGRTGPLRIREIRIEQRIREHMYPVPDVPSGGNRPAAAHRNVPKLID